MFTDAELNVLKKAESIIESKMRNTPYFYSPDTVKAYLQNKLVDKDYEVFIVLLMASSRQLIDCVEVSRGSIDSAPVYPREVAKLVIESRACSVILAHNHPSSGDSEPSKADKIITNRIVECLSLFDVRVDDHIIVAVNNTFSFAEKGLL